MDFSVPPHTLVTLAVMIAYFVVSCGVLISTLGKYAYQHVTYALSDDMAIMVFPALYHFYILKSERYRITPSSKES